MQTLLLDADGVTLKRQGEYFSERFAKEQSVSSEVVAEFFKTEFPLCQRGKGDVKEELIQYLSKWKWTKTVDDFLDHWFTTDTKADEKVFAEIERIRTKGIRCYLV